MKCHILNWQRSSHTLILDLIFLLTLGDLLLIHQPMLCYLEKAICQLCFSQRFRTLYRTKFQIDFGQMFTDQEKVSFCETMYVSFNLQHQLLFNVFRLLNNGRPSRIDVNHLHTYNNFTAIKINKNLTSKSSLM